MPRSADGLMRNGGLLPGEWLHRCESTALCSEPLPESGSKSDFPDILQGVGVT